MASLSDLIGGSTSNAPDAAATLVYKAQSSKGSFEYTSTLAAGKYVVKHNHGTTGKLKLSAPKAEVQVIGDDHAIIDLPEQTSRLKIDFESNNVFSGHARRELRRYFPSTPGTTNWASTTGYSSQRMVASDTTGKIWIRVSGYQGQLARSEDGGKTWTDIGRPDFLAGTSNSFYESWTVIYWKNRFIVSAGPSETGVSLTSTDGYSWTQLSTSLTTVTSADYSNDVAVFGRRATSANIVYTIDGFNFTQVSPSGLVGNVINVYWDGTRFIASDDGNRLSTSTNGITWTAASTLAFSIRSIVLIGSTYYAITPTGVVYSTTNLTSWSLLSTVSTATNYNHMLSAIGSTIVYYDPNNGQIRTSTDGITWTVRVTGIGTLGTLNRIYNGTATELFWFAGDRNDFFRSTDALDWGYRWQVLGGAEIRGMAFGAGLYVVGTTSATIATSPDGIYWTQRTSNTGNAIISLEYANGIFMYTTNSGQIGRSTDGITWTVTSNMLSNSNVNGISYGNNRWIAVGNNASIFTYTENNGVSWFNSSWSTGGNQMWSSAYATDINVWVAVGDSGTIMRSTDGGVNFTRIDNVLGNTKTPWGGTQLFTLAYFSVTYGNGKFVAVGDRVIATSTDGLNWVVRDNNTYHHTGAWRGVEYSYPGRFYAYGDSGMSAYSDDGLVWYSQPNGMSTTQIWAFTYGAGKFLYAGSSGIVRDSSDNLYWYHTPWSFSATTNYGAIRGKNEEYIFLNGNGIWRTNDFKNFQQPYFNTMSSGSNLHNIAYGNGVYVARSASTNIVHFSSNAVNWAVAESADGYTDVRGNNVVFADGYFWKIWQTNNSSKLSRSSDGRIWKDYYIWRNSDEFRPLYIKKVQNYYVAFGWRDATANVRYFYYTDSLLTNPDLWLRGDTGMTNTGSWQLTDIDGIDGLFVFAYQNNHAVVSPNIYGRPGSSSTGRAAFSLVTGDSNGDGQISLYHVFAVGDRLYGHNGTTLYEIRAESDQYNSTSTVVTTMARAYNMGPWNAGVQSYFNYNYGNGVVCANSLNVYEIKSAVPTTFSIYNSTVATVN